MKTVQFFQVTEQPVRQYLGNYSLLKPVGRGSFATVYLGKHRYLGTLAAIKVLRTRLAQDEWQRFLAEACLTAHLAHAHIVKVLDFGVENGVAFLVMEYAPSQTLRQLYHQGCRAPLATVMHYIKQVASALQYLHDRGYIHQDIKPENILLGEHDRALLSDFGVTVAASKRRDSGDQKIAGTVSYMAPEQIEGHPCRASDQYALGMVVYELLTGMRPFRGSTLAIVQQHLHDAPLPLRASLPTLPPTVERAVLKALAKRPEERFGSVQEFADALERAYVGSLTTPRRGVKGRKRRSLLRETARLPTISAVTGPAMALLPRVLGLKVEGLSLLLLIAVPLLLPVLARNRLVTLLTGSNVILSGALGLLFQSPLVFLWAYSILSFLGMLTTLSLSIQDTTSCP